MDAARRQEDTEGADITVLQELIRVQQAVIEIAVKDSPEAAVDMVGEYFEEAGVDDRDTRLFLDIWWNQRRLSAGPKHLSQHAELEPKLVTLCRELDVEMDGVKVPASAAAILNAIRECLEACNQ